MLEPGSIRRFSGFGRNAVSDGFEVCISSGDEVAEVYDLARAESRQIVVRGAGRSYGDAATLREGIVLDTEGLENILGFEDGVIHVEAGVTLARIWRYALELGYWLPVVSGTTFVSFGGAVGMNIHGKNAFHAGTIGEHVEELTVAFPSGTRTLRPGDAEFAEVIGSAGQLGVVVSGRLKMKKVVSGNVLVTARSCRNWEEQFEALNEGEADYRVSWVDLFSDGRGLVHTAVHDPSPGSLRVSDQELPSKIAGLIPKEHAWRIFRLFNTRPGMRLVNAIKHLIAAKFESGKTYTQTLAAFNFLLDYVPEWERSYLPEGLAQIQIFVPEDGALSVFREVTLTQQRARRESFLGVLKKHRKDRLPFMFSHAVDGYSLAMDFKVSADLPSLFEQIAEVTLSNGGRFYLAKDSLLRPEHVRRYLGSDLDRFIEAKQRLDPEHLLSSDLMKRVGL
ncbi:MAG TPA: FAD-binding oxidoreductase [Fimbriimonadaceae bacterium]|nr:FAD-binding oxidoreductase [Fimbriimonadaceae bacterium]